MSSSSQPPEGNPTLGKERETTSIKSKRREDLVVYLPANFPSCPPGLEKLIPADHLFVRQGIRMQEPPFTLISKHKFEVLNGKGQRIFLARESMDNILKLCCRGGCGQPFEMSIKDRHSGYEILAVNGHPDCYGALTASVSQNGMTLGFLNEELRCCSSNYSLIDAQGKEIFRIYDVSSFRSKWNRESFSTKKMHSKSHQNLPVTPAAPTTTDDIIITRREDNNRKNPENPNNNNHQEVGNGPSGDSSSSSPPPTTSCHTFDDTVRTTSDLTSSTTTTTTIMTTRATMAIPANAKSSKITKSQLSSGGPTVSYNVGKEVHINDNDELIAPGCSRSNSSTLSSKSKACCNIGLGRCLDSCVYLISGGVEFDLYSCEMGEVVGKMGKQWGDLYDQYFNLVDCFGVNFPRDLSVRHKVLILAALFLLDFNHFQI